ncbi:MAG: bifunctional phosphoribosylaminoimidazolecarboxamide formyltransferase/IMP cyclohydrolase [Planctomycetes bacterium]|uniref:bifunctional phosphoribosylaminoimidazolecarboxamide formyltransferase/IMP cyclohydrolase n=1 Tax=Candidatus Tripitaka californicus TaxID=3367616 RepID=UPI004024FD0C|nr:bifunctional phosphoribosylaminoimidazolecarboxamide formyltransferase/IMP cyclohydrolase [Planctomycetota bacterium]
MAKISRALISVYDKGGIVSFAAVLRRMGVELISSGGTARLLRDEGLEVVEVSQYTGFPEVMDGRVKTLHPKIHGGLLAIRDNPSHLKQMKELGILPIDMVVVNLYPFEKVAARKAPLEEVVENIDVGGPGMIRAAAKNYKHVAVVVEPGQYEEVLRRLEEGRGELSEEFCFGLAREAFRRTSQYDRAIADFFTARGGLPSHGQPFPSRLTLEFVKRQDLRYGENPHQSAAFYVEEGQGPTSGGGVSSLKQLSGKELSFNNILDLDASLELVREFEEPGAVIVKHTNPCGVGCASTLVEAFRRAYSGDPVSAFGCIIGFNREVDEETAEEVTSPGHFVEAITAPSFSREALEVLRTRRKWGQDLRLLEIGPLSRPTPSLDIKRVGGGILVQTRDIDDQKYTADGKVVTTASPAIEDMRDMRFAWIVAKHVKSNAIVLAREGTVVGVGAGQMSRVDAVEIALKKAGPRVRGAVMASDAFFPFRDSIDLAARAGVKAVIQPGGSTKDEEVIKAAEEHGLAMVFTGRRHFRH